MRAQLALCTLAAAAAARSPAYLGFEPTPFEQRFDHVKQAASDGAVPAWLRGTYYRNGPGQWTGDDSTWFMGLAYIASWTFSGGEVEYTARPMETSDYVKACIAAGACDAGRDVPQTALSAPVTFTHVNGSLLAVTEFTAATSIHPTTLAVEESPFMFTGEISNPSAGLPGYMAPSHDVLLDDGVRVHHYADIARLHGQTVVYETPRGTRERRVLTKIPYDDSGVGPYASRQQHQVLGTADWYIMFENPCFGVFGMFMWQPEKGSRIRAVNRHTGEHLLFHSTYNYYSVHQANAYVDGDELVADIVAVEDGCELATQNFHLSTLRDAPDAMNYSATAYMARVRMPLTRNGSTVTPVKIATEDVRGIEFPTIEPSRMGHAYTYAYMCQTTATSGWYDRLVKMNVRTGESFTFRHPGWHVGEVVFVPNPEPKAEDDGVALAVALDSATQKSVLVILDAQTWTLRAAVPAPEMLPFMFHGKFYPSA